MTAESQAGMAGYVANVVPGSGAVARWDRVVLLVGGEKQAGLDLIAGITDALGQNPDPGALIDALQGDGPLVSGTTDLVAAVETSTGMRIIVRGGAQARTETNELLTAGTGLGAGGGPQPTVRDLDDPMALWLGLTDPPTVQGHPAKDLRLGVVNGSGVVFYRVSEPAAEPAAAPGGQETDGGEAEVAEGDTPPPTVPNPVVSAPIPDAGSATEADLPVVDRDFQAINWDDPEGVAARAPLAVQDGATVDGEVTSATTGEQVMGIRCSRDHFNNPKAGYCQVCGISMVHLTHRLEPGPRPTLGFLVFADGATYALDRQYVIGRSPEPRPGGGLTPLQTQDPTQSVSREHAELRLDGWDAYYVDLGSTNGSFLWDAAGRRWDPIRPNNPVVLTSGTTVSVGRMTFVFEAASRAIESP
ncbi:MAG: FHA domain-containing protein [Actinomycetota bacterium]